MMSFYFPPYKRVGGRRWAKHCKYLKRMGINTHVLTNDFLNSVSPWDKDITEYENDITRIKLNETVTPYFKKELPQNFIDKLKWKLSLYIWNFKTYFIKGNFNDVSINSAAAFLKAAKKIISDKSINTIIISVGPYRYSEVFIALKKMYPDVKYVIDFRDYWEDGFNALSSKQVAFENEMQNAVVNTVDLILTPNLEMKNHFRTRFDKDVYCLQHCFDTDDIGVHAEVVSGSSVKLIYGGAFYNDIEENLELVRAFINKISEQKAINADFYVSIKGYEKELNHELIRRFDSIDSSTYFLKVQEADYVILILPPDRVNAMSSKFYELIALRKPIVYFGGAGDVSDYLIKWHLGYHITSELLNQSVDNILTNIKTQRIPDKNYDLSLHTFEYQTKLLLEKLQEL